MTIDQAIAALQAARAVVGGNAPLLMVDGEPLAKFDVVQDSFHVEGGCLYLCDAQHVD
jgi:hypothetical protein